MILFLKNLLFTVLIPGTGWAVLFRSSGILLYAANVALLFHLVVLVIEEPSLRHLFGPSTRSTAGRCAGGFQPCPATGNDCAVGTETGL